MYLLISVVRCLTTAKVVLYVYLLCCLVRCLLYCVVTFGIYSVVASFRRADSGFRMGLMSSWDDGLMGVDGWWWCLLTFCM